MKMKILNNHPQPKKEEKKEKEKKRKRKMLEYKRVFEVDATRLSDSLNLGGINKSCRPQWAIQL